MDSQIIEKYMNTIYAYARKRTYSVYEAEELTADIMYEIVKSISSIRDESHFEAWMWGLVDNVTKAFKRKMAKEKMYSYDLPDDYVDDEVIDSNKEEFYLKIREKVSMLTKIYRDIIILYYYDNLSTKQIASKLNIPEGTVTWRLMEARKKLKKELLDMNECALKPVKMDFSIHGNGYFNGKTIPFPYVYISDALSQNILFYCYEKPKSIEELTKCCGVPAYYIEESINNLLKREAVIEPVKGKYQTDFIIWSDEYGKFTENKAKVILMPIMNKLISMLKNITVDANKINFFKANRTETDLLYLYGALTFCNIEKRCNTIEYPPIKEKYDGYCWCYSASIESGKYKRLKLNINVRNNSKGKYNHWTYFGFLNINRRKLLVDDCINEYINLINGNKMCDQEAFVKLVEEGYIIKNNNGNLVYTIPVFTKEQREEFDKITNKYFEPLAQKYEDCVRKFINEYQKLFPKHLKEETKRHSSAIYKQFYSIILEYAIETLQIIPPSDDIMCDIIMEKK